MKVRDVTQTPFGTLLSLSDNLPENSLGNYLSVEGRALHIIKGISSDLWTEVLIEKTNEIYTGQDVSLFYNLK